MISEQRFLSPQKWDTLLKTLSFKLPTSVVGHSILKQPIYAHQIGKGPVKVLMWSQMHGNESTTTRALLNLFNHLHSPQGGELLKGLTLMIIPQLSPDGAGAYTRVNADGVDLNRDAQDLTQPESVVLYTVFEYFAPHFCFNLHGQRTIFAAGKKGKPATLSFLSPAADKQRTLTKARIKAMQVIAAINKNLQEDIPHQIGRYDDTFNPNCVGDRFTFLGVPTVLYEAGHYGMDYNRDFTKEMMLKSLWIALNSINTGSYRNHSIDDYHKIPENQKDYVDIIVENIDIKTENGLFKNQELALQYKEEKKERSVLFTPICKSFSQNLDLRAHRRVRANEIFSFSTLNFSPNQSIEIS
jgi:hypothetical protein